MVTTKKLASWLAQACISNCSAAMANKRIYTDHAVTAIKSLLGWYDQEEGLWNTTGWWNSANCLTVLGDFFLLSPDEGSVLCLDDVLANTFRQAQQAGQTVNKTLSRGVGLQSTESQYTESHASGNWPILSRGYGGFINNYYDDEGWWAMAWIRAYDVTGKQAYLETAERIFADMKEGVNGTCGGGIWWSKDRTYKNAIANELYLSVAASLANRAADSTPYLKVAEEQWAWFEDSGMINSRNLINDGLTIHPNGSCTNNREAEWSYNQGVVIGGLTELYRATGNTELLAKASSIAKAAINFLSDDNGILHDDVCEPYCGADGSQFKGIFMRNLQYLYLEYPQNRLREFILENAGVIWKKDRNSRDDLGLVWSGPPSAGGTPNASTHSSATDALVAAMAVF